MDYPITVSSAGSYNIAFRVASPHTGKQLQVQSGASTLATVDIPNTGGWLAWQTVTTYNITLAAGTQTLRVYSNTGGWNLNWLELAPSITTLNSANIDIGTVNPPGTGNLSGAGIHTITGSGLGITGTADKGHLYYDKLTGNGSIIAKVLSVQNTNASAKAGIMIRETTASGSKNVFLAFTPNGTVNFQQRIALNGTTTNTTAVAAIPSWLKQIGRAHV